MSTSLLPKANTEFSSASYWQDFFSKRKTVFEWYGDYASLCSVLHKYCRVTDKILVPGCGNSKLSANLYDAGIHSILNIDISPLVVKNMMSQNKNRIGMKFEVMDAKKISCEDGEFDVILDKGTLDALFTSDEKSVISEVRKYLSECSRVLTFSGRFICVSLAQNHIVSELLDFFGEQFSIRVHAIEQEEAPEGNIGSKLPIFVFVLTKMKFSLPSPLYEISIYNIELIQKVQSKNEVLKNIKDLQDYAMVQNHLTKTKLDCALSVELWSQDDCKEPRYTLTVVENPSKSTNGFYAIFIVPQGQENEWIYFAEEGQKELCECAGFKRLAIATLHRGHTYESIDQIKEELSVKVMDLAPPGLPRNVKVPFLTASEDVGYRCVQFETKTCLSGSVIIQDVQKQDQTYTRQMIFTTMRRYVQSEARLVNDASKNQKKKKKKHRVTDSSYLIWDVHKSMMASFAFLPHFNIDNLSDNNNNLDVLLIGIGGGCLPSFISKTFPQIRMKCLELDEVVLTIAKTWFSLNETENMKCEVKDGLTYIKEQSENGCEKLYDVIIFDVGESINGRIQVPPRAFVEDELLKMTKKLLKTPGALLVQTFDKNREVITNMKRHFSNLYLYDLRQDSSKLVIGLNSGAKQDIFPSNEELQKKILKIQKYCISEHGGKLNNNNFDLVSLVNRLSKI